MIDDIDHKICKCCEYYYGSLNACMVGEEGVPDNLEKKCEEVKEDDQIRKN